MSDPHAGVGFSITSTPDETSVNASIRPASAVERNDRTFRVLLVADLDPLGAPEDWAAGSRVRTVAPGEADALLAEWSPRLDLSVENTLGESQGRLDVAYAVESLADLTPGGIVAKVPALAKLAAVRAAISEVASGRLAADDLPDRLAGAGLDGGEADALIAALQAPPSTPSAPASAGNSAIDRLLGLVDAGEASGPPVPAPRSQQDRLLDALVSASSEPRPSAAASGSAKDLLETIDARLRAQVDAILNHPDVRALEGAWRGLRFVLERVKRGSPFELQVLAAGKDVLPEALYHQVLMPEHEGAETPLAAVVVDHAYGPTPPDVALLTDLAETAASLQVPFVVSAAPEVFGLDGPGGWAKLPPPRQAMARPEALGLQRLRERPEAPYLALAAPEFLLREPYGKDRTDRALGLEETGRLWGGAALLVAAAMAESTRETGWPTSLGRRPVSGLALRQTRMGALPLAAAWTDSTLGALAEVGVFAFSGPLNRDVAVSGYPAVFSRRKTSGSADEADPTLPGAMFAALAAHHALKAGPALAGLDEAAAVDALERRLRTVFGSDPDAVTVQALPEHDTDETRTLGVRIRPSGSILSSSVGVVIGVDVLKAAPAEG